MSQSAKLFSERLQRCLDETDAPPSIRERAAILSKIIDISKQSAFSMLEGYQLPTVDMLEKIASEFEVEPNWLSGEK